MPYKERPEDDLEFSEDISDEEPAKEPPEAPEWPQEADVEPEAPEPLKPHEVAVEAPELTPEDDQPPSKPIGIEPVPDEPVPPVATRQPVEWESGPQPEMSLKDRFADWLAKGGEESGIPRPGRAAPGYEAGEYARRPEPKIDEEAGRGPGIIPHVPDPFGVEDKAPPVAEAPEPQSGTAGTDALIDAIKEGNASLKELLTAVNQITNPIAEWSSKLDEIQSAIENIETGIFKG